MNKSKEEKRSEGAQGLIGGAFMTENSLAILKIFGLQCQKPIHYFTGIGRPN